MARTKKESTENLPETTVVVEETVTKKAPTRKRAVKPTKETTISAQSTDLRDVLTINAGDDFELPTEKEDIVWHELQNAYRGSKMLTGTIDGVESTEMGTYIVTVYYKEQRIVIPYSEMMINLSSTNTKYGSETMRQGQIINTMIGAEIDFVIKGLEKKSKTVVASRKDAMLKKRSAFFMPRRGAQAKITEGRVVQARIISVASKSVRVDVFGVECNIPARELRWEWIGDVTEQYRVGDMLLVRISNIENTEDAENLKVTADAKSVTPNTVAEKLRQCKVQGKYAGRVTDVHKGVVFIRLNQGVNAVAHSCLDRRMPGKKDDVTFVVTHINEEQNVAMGLITRIIKQNI